jgi:glutaredoxin
MTPEEMAVIETWSREIKGNLLISKSLTDDPRSAQISDFCTLLNEVAPLVTVSKADDADDGRPFIQIQKQIKYKGVPQGRELLPFLNVIYGRESDANQMDTPDAGLFEKIQLPARLKLYISPQCPHCPRAVSALSMLTRRSEKIQVEVIDAEMYADLARLDHVRSVPTVILDDQFRWTGSINLAEIIDLMISQDPDTASAQSLRGIIEAGNAAELARMMDHSQKIYPAYIELLVHPKWPVRLGAMAAFEYLLEVSPDLAEEARFKLWERFEPAEDSVKGDVLYLMGGSRHPAIQSHLISVINGDYSEQVREAAREALEVVNIPE